MNQRELLSEPGIPACGCGRDNLGFPAQGSCNDGATARDPLSQSAVALLSRPHPRRPRPPCSRGSLAEGPLSP